jgi:hypothetical protein
MSEFQLYKKRDFSAFMSDTLQFFKQFWKNYFRNYVVINGALLLLMCVTYFLVFKDMIKNLYTPGAPAGSWLTSNSNPVLMGGGILLFLAVIMVLSVFTTAFPMVYLKLLRTKGEESFTSSEIFRGIKSYAGRMIGFGFISLVVLLPMGIVVFGIGAALSIIIIGIPMLLLALPTFMIWTMQILYVYLEEELPYFDALRKGWKITFDNYWHVVGSTMVTAMFVMIVGSIFTMVPSIMSLSSIITSGGHPKPMVMTPVVLVLYIFGMIFSYVTYNILYVQQGLVYYSSQENSVNYQAFSEVDSIGSDEE